MMKNFSDCTVFEHCYFCKQKDHEWKCDLCFKQYGQYGCIESRKEFEDHIKWRHDRNCYICEQCNNWYESREELEDHRRIKHIKNGTRNICLECGEEFESMEELFEHENEYCYICEQCDNGYETREELEYHRNIKHI